MPRIIYSPIAILDLERLYTFLQTKDPDVARQAITEIKSAINTLKNQPDRCRPVPDKVYHRELVIDFGASGYIARFYKKSDQEVVILAIRHQLENDFYDHW